MAKLKVTFEEFSARVEKAYNGRISVVESTYMGIKNKVTAYCNVHKIYFEVNEARCLYMKRANCPECAKERRKQINEEKIIPFAEMLKRFHDAYGNKFLYDESSYQRPKMKMKVHCNDCGEDFEITPIHHLKYNNGGCPNCHKHKIVKCSKCGKEIEADRHVGDNFIIYCDDCQPNKRREYCNICGSALNDEFKCNNDFCNEHHILTFKTLIKYFQFDETKLGTKDAETEFYRIRTMLNDMYWNKHLTSSLICKIFNYPDPSHLTNNVFFHLEIPIKSISESVKEAIKNGVIDYKNISNNQYKSSHHITWDNKDVYLRSSYELDYAQLLDESKILYEVEKLRISYFDSQKQKERIAIPDFYLPETNTIVEIKSSWTLNVINMIDKVKEYKKLGYNFKLIYEHKETDIFSLINEPVLKHKNVCHSYIEKPYKTKIGHKKWKWMNNGIEIFKIPIDEIDEYLQKGFILGVL